MNYTTVYVGMDVHKETFSLCCYTNEKEAAEYHQKMDAHYSKILNQVTDEEKGEVTVTNNSGTFRHKINIHHADKPGQYRVIPVNSIEDGILWNPAIVDGKHAVELNTSHPYYQKVYYPVLEQNVMVTGMDALLWAMAEAELSVGNQETMELFEEMRFMVSRCLKKLVADLPDPQLSEEE